MNILTKNADVSFIDGLTITGLCMLIVFAMLIVLALLVSLIQYVNKLQKKAPVLKEIVKENKPLQIEDIKDEDMMVAALVASIDYYNETKNDVRVVSIKQID